MASGAVTAAGGSRWEGTLPMGRPLRSTEVHRPWWGPPCKGTGPGPDWWRRVAPVALHRLHCVALETVAVVGPPIARGLTVAVVVRLVHPGPPNWQLLDRDLIGIVAVTRDRGRHEILIRNCDCALSNYVLYLTLDWLDCHMQTKETFLHFAIEFQLHQ